MRRIKRIERLEKEKQILGRKVFILESREEANRGTIDHIMNILYKSYPIPTGYIPELKDQFK